MKPAHWLVIVVWLALHAACWRVRTSNLPTRYYVEISSRLTRSTCELFYDRRNGANALVCCLSRLP